MRFDFIIGNPPYQDNVENKGDRPNPIYDKFMDEAYSLADIVELITPGRFLFNAGQTAKDWNKKMLCDTHLKVLDYYPKSSDVFVNADIKGGVAITIHNINEFFGEIGTFTAFSELNNIVSKVKKTHDTFLNSIVSSQGIYHFSKKAYVEFPEIQSFSGKGTGSKIVSSIVEKLPDLFLDMKPQNGCYVEMIGRSPSGRFSKFILREYLEEVCYTDAYKVLIPEANGSGAIGEVLSTPLIGEPLIGVTDTFLCVGCFDNKKEAEALFKYIKTKFARCMLGVNKVTQHNPKSTWKDVPLQDFTANSDIDWSKSIPEIDQQLYAKYGLDEEEITFIESHVKEMM